MTVPAPPDPDPPEVDPPEVDPPEGEPLSPGERHDQLVTDLAGYGLKAKSPRPLPPDPTDPDPGLTGDLARYGVARRHSH